MSLTLTNTRMKIMVRNIKTALPGFKTFYMLVCCIIYCCNTEAQLIIADKMIKHQDNIVIKRILKTKNQAASVYQDKLNKNLFFTSIGNQGKNCQLFLFDMDGKLVSHTNILSNQTELISKISRGNYLFEVFSNDERIENGSIAVK